MDDENGIDNRFTHRYNSFDRALNTLEFAVELSGERPLSDLEAEGLIQRFEFTFELAWKLLKDYLKEIGFPDIGGPREVIRRAFAEGIISDGVLWMDMLKHRNLSTHVYDEEVAQTISSSVISSYANMLAQLRDYMTKHLPQEGA
jgi:nucleotidyltransferase substrate binding protein (TIGR01987 family)